MMSNIILNLRINTCFMSDNFIRQNLIADYSRQVPLSLETHDLILTYNE